MNKNEYGNYIRIDLNLDLSPFTMSIILTSPVPYVIEKIITQSSGLTIGVNDISIGDQTYIAGQYVEYKIEEGDIFISGNWEIQVKAETINGDEVRFSDLLTFNVKP